MGSSAILEMGGKEPERVKDVVMDSVSLCTVLKHRPEHAHGSPRQCRLPGWCLICVC